MEINQATNITKKLFSVNITKKQYIYPMIFTKQLFLLCLGGRKLIFENTDISQKTTVKKRGDWDHPAR